jgi:hypothetical protein
MLQPDQLKGLLIEVVNRREQIRQYIEKIPTLSDNHLIDLLKLATQLTTRADEATAAWRDVCLWCTSAKSAIEDEATRRDLIKD